VVREWVRERQRERETEREATREGKRGKGESAVRSLSSRSYTLASWTIISKNKHKGHSPEIAKNSAAVAILLHQLRANKGIVFLLLNMNSPLNVHLEKRKTRQESSEKMETLIQYDGNIC